MEFEDCLKKFKKLTKRIAPLHAIYGPGGTWFLQRDRLKAELFSEWFNTLKSDGSNPKRIDVEQQVLLDSRWKEALEKAERCREELFQLYGRRQTYSWMIQHKLDRHSKLSDPEMTDEVEEVQIT